MNIISLRWPLALGFSAVAALAHYTWIAPAGALLEVGKAVTLTIAHGHHFPESEEAINASQLNLFVIAPSAEKVPLPAAAAGTAVKATFTPKQAGFHRIAFVQDRGITSRTPSGVKKGGRDQNPNATQASRTFRTAITYAHTAKASAVDGKPLGLEFELTGTLAQGGWTVQLLKNGKPVADAAIEVFLAGAGKAMPAGKTGPDGKVRFQPAAGAKPPALFSAMRKDPMPAGSTYDFVNYETSLYVNW